MASCCLRKATQNRSDVGLVSGFHHVLITLKGFLLEAISIDIFPVGSLARHDCLVVLDEIFEAHRTLAVIFF